MGQARRLTPKRLPEKLLRIRTLLGLTQEQMVERLSYVAAPPQSGQISRFEQGKREPSLLVLLAYARLAGMSMGVLVDDALDLPARLPGTPHKARVSIKVSKRRE